MRMRRTRRKVQQPGQLRITSMMDILTVLLLFLLKSFVAEGEVVTPAPGVTLPQSSAEVMPEASLVIAIADDRITLGDEVVANLDGSVDGGLGNQLLIERLADRLDDARAKQDDIALRRGQELEDRGKVTIQGDRDMPFEVLQRVMYTCNQTGFDDIALAVIRG